MINVLAPGQGMMVNLRAAVGETLQAEQPLFSWRERAQAAPGYYGGPVNVMGYSPKVMPRPGPMYYNPGGGAPNSPANLMAANYTAEEQRIRERYRRLMEEANGYIRSCQDSLNQAYTYSYSRRSGSPDPALAQRALQRAQNAPRELNAQMEAELSSLRSMRESSMKGLQGQPVAVEIEGDQTVKAREPLVVFTWLVKGGEFIQTGQPCVAVLPQGSECRYLALLPTARRNLVAPGSTAVMETHPFLQDGEELPLVVESIASRVLDADEMTAVAAGAPMDGPCVLMTLKPLKPDLFPFPPPLHVRIKVRTLRRSLLGRWF